MRKINQVKSKYCRYFRIGLRVNTVDTYMISHEKGLGLKYCKLKIDSEKERTNFKKILNQTARKLIAKILLRST